ncbi:unnamed protein product [Arctogadus glacialis]
MAQMLEGQTEVTSVCLEGDRYRQASDDHFNEPSIIGCRVINGLPPGAFGPLTGPYSNAKRQPVGGVNSLVQVKSPGALIANIQ